MRGLWLPLCCGVLQSLSVSVGASGEPPAWASATSLGIAVVSAAALLARSRAPQAVLAVASAGAAAQALIARPALPAVAAVAVFTVARQALTAPAPAIPAAAVAGSAVTVGTAVALSGQESLAAPFALALVLAAVGGLLAAVRTGRAAEARRALLHAERLRIARDLHDTVGHGVGAMTVQAGAGRMAIAAGAVEDATRAMLGIEEAGRSVLRDVRWMVGLLRDEQEQHRLSDISELVDSARRAGLQVEVEEQGDLSAASPAVGEVAYRVVQEAITNVLRHSTATEVLLRLTRTDQLTVEVHDSGAPVADVLPGNGLRGMQERVREVGGTVEAGPDPAGGWTVVVRLPVSGRKR